VAIGGRAEFEEAPLGLWFSSDAAILQGLELYYPVVKVFVFFKPVYDMGAISRRNSE
jgi:hypothetical protein